MELVSQFEVSRGLILAANDKTVLAANRKVKRNGQTFFFRRYPTHGMAAQTVGYSTSALSQPGLEESLPAKRAESRGRAGGHGRC